MWLTHGHKNQKLFLEKALKKGEYSHAYLFCGPAQVGKKTLAVEFAKKILQTDQDFHPDLLVVGDEKYKVENIRNLISELSLKPYQAQYKIAILDNFENATPEAASSILKTLEEPSPSTIIFLITENREALLKTVVSRTQIINFHKLSSADISKHTADKTILETVSGRIGKIFNFNTEEALKGKHFEEHRDLEQIRQGSQPQRLLWIKKYSEFESNELSGIFKNWLDREHYKMLNENPARYQNLNLLFSSLDSLKQNLNKKLILEKLFLNLK